MISNLTEGTRLFYRDTGRPTSISSVTTVKDTFFGGRATLYLVDGAALKESAIRKNFYIEGEDPMPDGNTW